jgi:hypothetical protein
VLMAISMLPDVDPGPPMPGIPPHGNPWPSPWRAALGVVLSIGGWRDRTYTLPVPNVIPDRCRAH